MNELTLVQKASLEHLVDIFREHRYEEYRIKVIKYIKDKFDFLGIKAPVRIQLSKPFILQTKDWSKEDIKSAVYYLYDLPEREFHYVAIDLIIKRIKLFDFSDFEFGEFLILNHSWWDSVDSVASNFFGHILKEKVLNNDFDYIRTLMKHENMWMNRVSIIFQLKYKDMHHEEIMYETILFHQASKEFFIQKAAGWALRQYSKFNPDSVRQFIAQNSLSNLTIREGSKYI